MNNTSADRGELNFSSLSLYRNAVYGVAAIWIVLFHGIILKGVELPAQLRFLTDTFQLGNISVDIFLLLSGIGLYFSFSKDGRVLRFYYKRIVRVWLPYLLMAAPFYVYVYFFWVKKPLVFIQAFFTVNYWTGERKPVEFWYVSAILVFYLIYPLIYKAIFYSGKGSLLRTVLLAAASMAVCFVLWYCARDAYDFLEKILPRLTVFIIGCYLGKPVKEKKSFSVIWVILGVAIIAAAYPLYARGGLSGIWRRYYGCLTGIALTFVLSQAFAALSKLKLDRFFAFFGGFSLEIYIATIIARVIFYISPLYTGDLFGRYLIVSAAAIGAAYLVSLIQKPLLKLLMKPMKT